MKKLLFLDVEATGINEEDRLCQVAYRSGEEDCNEFFKPPVPIKHTAMAVTHITNEMVAEKPPFIGSKTYLHLKTMATSGVILVAHNAPYDLKMLAKEGVVFPQFIDTLKVVKALDKEGILENHQLQYLRYKFGVQVDAVAHDAFGDILVLHAVFGHLMNWMREGSDASDEELIDDMIDISIRPSLIKTFRFGKYDGQSVEQISKADRGYLEWLLGKKKEAPDGEEDWIYTLNHYLKK